MLIVPKIVLLELDGHKESRDGQRELQARDAIRAIENHRAFDWLNLREESHTELLSDDLDKSKNDCKILSIALKYIIRAPLLITDDKNLRNLADAYAIESIGSDDFIKREQTKAKGSKPSKKKTKKRR